MNRIESDSRRGEISVVLGEGRIGVGTGGGNYPSGRKFVAVSFQEFQDINEIGGKIPAGTSDVVGPKFWLGFSNPASIDVVIGQLKRVKKRLKAILSEHEGQE